ncbi:MAG TPA: type II toxin-antitoxin system PemK/MazF family toxin [Candidatus Paceibacterota bacterium]
MDIPAKVTVPICIEQGAVYLYQLEATNHDGTPYKGDRFMIVLNANPKTDTVLVLATITKQIENQRKYVKNSGESPETLVDITPSDFVRLKQDSVVNCNNVYETSLSGLISKIEDGGKFFTEKLPKSKISEIAKGVLLSKQVTPEQKKLLV